MWVGGTRIMRWYNIIYIIIISLYLHGAGRTQKIGAPWTGTPVTPCTAGGDLRLSVQVAGGETISMGSAVTGSVLPQPVAGRTEQHPRQSVFGHHVWKVAHNGLRNEQCRDWPRPSTRRQGTILAVDGTAFQRRSDATAQRQLPARLRKFGYVWILRCCSEHVYIDRNARMNLPTESDGYIIIIRLMLLYTRTNEIVP